MNTTEARSLLNAEMENYRTKTYGELVALIGNGQNAEVVGPSGVRYNLEIQAFWDDPRKPNENLRVIGTIDDGGLRALAPISDDFIIARNGAFVGE
jgi:hypothetical protein